jgi:hypothetical protein
MHESGLFFIWQFGTDENGEECVIGKPLQKMMEDYPVPSWLKKKEV